MDRRLQKVDLAPELYDALAALVTHDLVKNICERKSNAPELVTAVEILRAAGWGDEVDEDG
jgi:hypothetical protein